MSDVYAYWRAVLAGRRDQSLMLPTTCEAGNPDNPQPGLWRVRPGKGAAYVPIQIWLAGDDGKPVHLWRSGLKLAGTIGGAVATVDEIDSRWLFAQPVSKTDFASYHEHGRWPGDVDGIGHNSGDLSLAEQVKEYAAQALGWLRKIGTIADKQTSDMAANYRSELLRLAKDADKQRDAEKRPHDEAAKAVQAKWKPVIDEAQSAADQIRAELTRWMNAEQARLEAERRAKWEAEQKAAAAERARIEAERAQQMRDDPIAALTSPEPELPTAPPPPEPVKVQAGGQRGRKAGLREVTTYVVTDHAAALAFFADSEQVRELVQKLASQAMKAGVVVPGVEAKVERVAA
jgi:nucleotide-binding universal stress UspA family protein